MQRPHGQDGIGTQLGLVLARVVDQHLGSEGQWPLRIWFGEVGEEVIERCLRSFNQLRTEPVSSDNDGLVGTAEIVLEQDEGDVIPVLNFARPYSTLTKQFGKPATPAMAAEVSNHV